VGRRREEVGGGCHGLEKPEYEKEKNKIEQYIKKEDKGD